MSGEVKTGSWKTTPDPVIKRFDLGKMYFPHIGKTFVFWDLNLGKLDIGKRVCQLGKMITHPGKTLTHLGKIGKSSPAFPTFQKCCEGAAVKCLTTKWYYMFGQPMRSLVNFLIELKLIFTIKVKKVYGYRTSHTSNAKPPTCE